MQRYNFFFRQKVTEGELDAAFDAVELAVGRLLTDFSYSGVSAALLLTETVPSPSFSILVTGPGIAYDQAGNRIFVPTTQTLNCAVDENGVNTAVVTPGRSRILSVFAEFNRSLSDPRLDGNGDTVYYNRAESFTLNVVQGAEFITGDPGIYPPLRSDQILLGDIEIAYSATSIVDADIDMDARRQLLIQIPSNVLGGLAIDAFTPNDALTQMADALNDHAEGIALKHDATMIDYGGGGAWADGTTNPATTVEAQLDKFISDLASAVGDGAMKIGLAALATTWADGTSPSGASVRASLLHIISTLGSGNGALKIGIDTLSSWADGTTNPDATLRARIESIISRLADQVGTDDGAAKIGIGGSGFAWVDAIPFSNSTVRARLLKIVTDLAATTSIGGSERIGSRATTSTNTNPQVTIGAGDVYSQLTVANNYVHGTINDAFYDRVLNARFEQILAAAAVAGDGIVCADWSGLANAYLAVRRVAANNDSIYSGRGLDNAMNGTTTTVTSTDIKALTCADDATTTPILVGSRNPTSGGALLAYLSTPSTNAWTIVTLPAPATTSGAVLWDAVFLVSQSRWCVCGYDGSTVFFQYGGAGGTSFATGTVTATASTPAAIAQGGTNMVCVGSAGWVFYSSGGITWSRVQLGGGTPNFNGVCYNPTRGRYYATAGSNGIWESTDGTGSAWTQLSLPANLSGMSFMTIACDELGRMAVSMQHTTTFISYIGATVDWFQSCRIAVPEGRSTSGGWEANPAGKARYRRGRFMFGDFPTGGKGAVVSTAGIATFIS